MRIFLLVLALTWGAAAAAEPVRVVVGSKSFTESVVVGEMLAHLLEDAGLEVQHRKGLGGTQVLWNALNRGDIDLYPEYSGTLLHEILARDPVARLGLEAVRLELAGRGILMSAPLGFNNTYAIGMRRNQAEALGITTVSQLRDHPQLRLGFSTEFMDRADGWHGLRETYDLPQQARGLDHDLAYRALENGDLDVIDLYSTDAEIRYYDLKVLRDDRHYFPDYLALILYRAELLERAPQVVAALARLEGSLDEAAMTELNARAKLDRVPEAAVAEAFLDSELDVQVQRPAETPAARLWRLTKEHLVLVGISLSAAILVAIPLGIAAARRPRLGQIILAITGILQTIPSLALLVFMIPLLGIGAPPAIMALFLYSLLPIVRNTYTGLKDIPRPLLESADALGLPPRARLLRVELPMASRTLLAGIKISAVINVGTATLGALIGAGGYGQPILTGIRLDDMGLILQGAVPAALLALLVQGLFELADRLLVPRGLRLKRA